MSINKLFTHIHQAALASGIIVGLLLVSFFVFEPVAGRTQATDTSGPFSITQEITGELAFITDAADVTMVSDISGLTGGNATGTTQFAVRSNSGYTVSIAFEDNGSEHAMLGETTGEANILDYASTSPSYFLNTATTSAIFAYTVGSSTATAENSYISDNFLNSGPTCGSGSFTDARCWMGPTTTDYEIVNNTSSAPNGATSTLTFRVFVPSGAVPAVDADFYTATATLTATEQ